MIIEIVKDLLNKTQKKHKLKTDVDKLDFAKIENFCSSKYILRY